MELALAATAGWVITTCAFLAAMREKDRSHNIQISGLLNRIQAPEVTVAQELMKDEDYEPIVLAHTEESYWKDVEGLVAD